MEIVGRDESANRNPDAIGLVVRGMDPPYAHRCTDGAAAGGFRNRHRLRVAGFAAALLFFGLVVAACDGAAGADTSKSITIGHTAWPEDIAVTYLWHEILEQRGYEVTLRRRQVDQVFAGMAVGNIDLFMDTWRPNTHEKYWNTYGEQLVELGRWYDRATLELAVPTYMKAASIGDLDAYAGELNGMVVGIGLDAGETGVIKGSVLPEYGLEEDFRYVSSSTAAMLASLRAALRNDMPIVVALWHPHWAYDKFSIKDLEDPKGALGKPEDLSVTARREFPQDQPTVASWIGSFKLDRNQLDGLVGDMHDAQDRERAAAEWISEHQRLVNGWAGPPMADSAHRRTGA